jgi:leader peptidase (prepilin peptidase)/N-methyltransferase
VNIPDSTPDLAAAAVAALAAGVAVGGPLIEIGLAQLPGAARRRAPLPGRVSCGLGAAAAVIAAHRAGSWWLLPALLAWALGLCAAATCDALTQRIPTRVVRPAQLTAGLLLLAAAAATGHWRWAVSAAVCAAAAAAIFALCWRFLGLGFGDVRLAALGGTGLAHPTPATVAAAVAVFAVITAAQATSTLARGGDRRTPMPYGTAIAAAFLTATLA